MKIIYIHQYFKTPQEGGAIRSYHLAKALVAQGHQVEMITTHNQKNYQHQYVKGISVHCLPVFYDNHLGFWGRLRAFVRFVIGAYRKAKSIKGADVCYATSTPLTVGLVALLLKRRYKLKFFFEVRDLWPQAAIELGFLKNKWLIGLALSLEKKIYRNADKIIALSPPMQAYIKAKVPQKQVIFIPNLADTAFFEVQFQLPSKFFTVLYIGTLGLANHLDYLLDLAHLAQKRGNTALQFKIMGEGGQAEKLIKRANDLHLQNVLFLPKANKIAVKEALSTAQAVYISFKDLPTLQTNSPNKFFDGLASGKLMIVNTKGWLKDLVTQHQCGFYAPPNAPAEALSNLLQFIENPHLLLEYQKNARKLAEKEFSLQVYLPVFLELFEQFGQVLHKTANN